MRDFEIVEAAPERAGRERNPLSAATVRGHTLVPRRRARSEAPYLVPVQGSTARFESGGSLPGESCHAISEGLAVKILVHAVSKTLAQENWPAAHLLAKPNLEP